MIDRFGTDSRYTSMVLFDAFQDALQDLMTDDKYLFEHKSTKATIAHQLVVHMHHRLREKLSLSLDTDNPLYLTLPGNLIFDIMIDKTDIKLHDRNGKNVMSIMLYHDYIHKKETEQLKKLDDSQLLTLAVSFLPGKPYVLIYRVNKETIDYYHYDYTANSARLRMQKDRGLLKDNGQLPLLKTHRRKQKNGE